MPARTWSSKVTVSQVENATPDELDHFVRKLASEQASQRFVEARLAAYERMWDG